MKKKAVLVMGHGGHTSQMFILRNLLGNNLKYCYVTCREHKYSSDLVNNFKPTQEKAYKFLGTRTKDSTKIHDILGTLAMIFQAIFLIILERPNVVISCGTSASVPLSFIGKLFGKKIIYIETRARINELSGAGKIIYPIADLFFVQWEELQQKYPKTIYTGRF